ncbi:Alpha/Beta hydrolase protein [Scleroderma yunnanense]
MDPASFQHCEARLSTGRTYHFVDQKPQNYSNETQTLLCVHGFPDLWYGWRYQIGPWVERGYRVVVPDMLGFGKTDMPTETWAYSTKHLCSDLAALLDHIGVHKAVFIGHDWGAYIGTRFALWQPDRLLALAIVSVPYAPPREQYFSLEQMVEHYPAFSYMLYFASEESTVEVEAHLPAFFSAIYRSSTTRIDHLLRSGRLREVLFDAPVTEGCILNEEERSYYISNYRRGMIGPLSYYRTTEIRFEEELAASLPNRAHISLPVFFIGGTEDRTCSLSALETSKALLNNLTAVILQGRGHWLMIEAADSVTQEILRWLESLALTTPGSQHKLHL